MDTLDIEVEPSPSSSQRKFRIGVALLLAAFIATTSIGCAAGSTQPHVTAKVIFQDESGVAAEVSSEWR